MLITKNSQLPLLNSIVERALEYETVFIDLFCGAGGVTSGIEEAVLANGQRVAKVIACINHDKVAIASHHANWSDALHLTEDIRTAELSEIVWMVKEIRKRKPDMVVCLWASLECTNFSKAKGGMARNADSRTLAEHLFRYVEVINPEMIWIENVEEFLAWGPMVDGKPVSRLNGTDFQKWRSKICRYGYACEHKVVNAADFGAYTSRKRLFIQFAKPYIPITWAQPTHTKKASGGMFNRLAPWKPVKEVLDFKDEGESIFGRDKALVEKTLQRIYAGLVKYVGNGDTEFLQAFYSNGDNVTSVEQPCPTVTTKDRFALVRAEPWIMDTQFSNVGTSTDEPAGVITANRKWHYLMTPQWGIKCSTAYDTDSPTMLLIKQFMAAYGIADIKMRMLRIPELLKIQGFHDGYILLGTQADQKKFIGNSVPPPMVRALITSAFEHLYSPQAMAI